MTREIDPRAKLIIVICIATLGVVINNIVILFLVSLIGIIISYVFKGDFFAILKKLKKFVYIFIVIIIVQSLCISEGNVILGNDKIKILTDVGIIKGVEFLLRMNIILLSGVIISTSNMRKLIQGLVQWKLPYDIAFMVSIGIRFMPILLEEMKDTITAINLRGIEIKKLKLKERIQVYNYILTPIVVSTLSKAKKISISIETRGFRAYDKRTSIIELKLGILDYIIIFSSILMSIIVVWVYIFFFK